MLAPLVVARVRTRAQGHLSTLYTLIDATLPTATRPSGKSPSGLESTGRGSSIHLCDAPASQAAPGDTLAPLLHPSFPTLTPTPWALFLVVLGHAHTIRIAVLGLGARKARRDLNRGRVRVVGIPAWNGETSLGVAEKEAVLRARAACRVRAAGAIGGELLTLRRHCVLCGQPMAVPWVHRAREWDRTSS